MNQLAAKRVRGPKVTVPACLTREEWNRARQRFCNALYMMGTVDAYWIPDKRACTFRIADKDRKGVPEEAVRIGRYRSPAFAAQFADDIAALIQSGAK